MASSSCTCVFAPLPFLFAVGIPSTIFEEALTSPREEEAKREEELKTLSTPSKSHALTPTTTSRTAEASKSVFCGSPIPVASPERIQFASQISVLVYSLTHANLKFDLDQLKKTCLFINHYRTFYRESCLKKRENVYLPTALSLHDRPVQFNTDGTVFVHFNRKKQGDTSIGKTAMKSISVTMNVDTGELFASSGINNEILVARMNLNKRSTQTERVGDLELRGMYLTRNVPGFIRGMYPVSYLNKKKFNKVRVILPWYRYGTLEQNLKYLSLSQKIDIACQLLNYLVSLHGDGLIHRDLKESNIFITKIGKKYEVVIGDLGTVCIHEEVLTKLFKTTSWYASPEYAKAILNETCLSDVTNEKLDIWSMGCILFRLFYPAYYTELPGRESRDNAYIFAKLAVLPEDWLPAILTRQLKIPRPSPIDVLISRMLQVNPKRRIGPEDLAKEVHAFFPILTP